MAERILLTPSEMKEVSSSIKGKADEAKAIFEEIQKLVQSLEESWDGAAQDQFFELYDGMHPQIMQVAEETLPGLADTIEAVASAMEEADAEIASSLKGNG